MAIKDKVSKIPGYETIFMPVYQFLVYGGIGPFYKWSDKALFKYNMRIYRKRQGYSFNPNKPVLFTEKLQLYKFYYNHPDIHRITDKVTFKTYIKEKLGEGYTIPLYGVWDNVQDLEAEWNNPNSILPNEFVLKQNLQSDGLCIIIIHDKSKIPFSSIKQELASWLDIKNTLMNSTGRHMYWSKPMILAEQYMSNYEDQLFDYKFFCFNGEIRCIYVAQEHFSKEDYPISFYNSEWQKLPVKYGHHSVCDAPCPKHFNDMIGIARKLSQGFPFIRVDFFDTEDKLYLAELTFVPGGGNTPYYPVEFNKQLGDIFNFSL